MTQTPFERVTTDLTLARARLMDRGIDPDPVLGQDDFGESICVAGLYNVLGIVAASEKAGQGPTHIVAQLALQAGLPSEVADTLYLAYNQQSAEEAGHGDKVFGNAYFVLGGIPVSPTLSVVGNPDPTPLLAPEPDPKQNRKKLGLFAAVLGGIETVALQRTFPTLVALCERWDHPVARDLLVQIRDVVRPEESRHVLLFRYAFHQLIASKPAHVIDAFFEAMNAGRTQVGAPAIDRETFARLVGSSPPTPRQLLGKERTVLD